MFSPPPRSSQMPPSPAASLRVRRTRKVPKRFGDWVDPSSMESLGDQQELVQEGHEDESGRERGGANVDTNSGIGSYSEDGGVNREEHGGGALEGLLNNNPPELVYSSGGEDSDDSDLEELADEGSDRDTSEDIEDSENTSESDREGEEDDHEGVEREDHSGDEEAGQVFRPPPPPPLPPGGQQQDQPQLGGQVQGELLHTRVRPAVPGPERLVGDGDVDADGWAVIDSVGAWECMLVKFAMLKDIPAQHEEAWVEAFSKVLQRIEDATSPTEVDRALKWLCFLPQALLRKPSRGGKGGRGLVAKRFNALVVQDWGKLVTLWQEDVGRLRNRQTRETVVRSEEEEEEFLRRTAVDLISQGQISKAVSRISSNGVADIGDPGVREQLREKYPQRGRELPARVERRRCVDGLGGLRDDLKSLDRGVAPGCGGLRNEFLKVLANKMTQEQMQLMEMFGVRYLGGELPEWFYCVWLSVQSVALFKTMMRDTVRPIGIKNPLAKSFHRQAIQQNKPDLLAYLEPEQLVLSKGGAAKLINTVRSLSENRRDFIVVKVDIENAFNAISRAAIIENLQAEPSLQHLAWFAALTLSPELGLESGGELWGKACEGETQGDTKAGAFFCVGIQPLVRELCSTVGDVGGVGLFGMDDGYVAGPSDVVLAALERFERGLLERCGLVLQRAKTEVFSWDGVMPREFPPEMVQAGKEVDGEFLPGFICYGVPVGCDAYVRHMLNEKVEEVAMKAEKAVKVLRGERQALWSVLKWSLSQQFEYWLQLSYPSDVKEAAAALDRKLWRVLEACIGSLIPEGGASDSVMEGPLGSIQGLSFQQMVVRLPVKMGGLGLRSQEHLRYAAFVGAVEQSVPQIGTSTGLCPALGHWLGGDECFGQGMPSDTRWQVLISSGTRLGLEYREAWEALKLDAEQCAEWVGDELEGGLAVPVSGAGMGCNTGATRKVVMEQMEKLWGKVVKEVLDKQPDRRARPVMSWSQRDKLSSAWLLALPAGDTSLSSPVFAEAAAALLCLPSPACADKIGCEVGNRRVDQYGDQVQAARGVEGDDWRKRHDSMKMMLSRMLRWARMPFQCEVFNMFAHLIPQEGLSRMERGRKRQGLVPDFLLELDGERGQKIDELAELKVICCCPSRYSLVPPPPHPDRESVKAVDKRARVLTEEYSKKAKKVDRVYGGADVDVVGRVQRKLMDFGEVRGLVFGAFGEASEGVHELVHHLASSKLKAEGLQQGRETAKGELGVLVGQVRRLLSVASVRAQAECLLSKLRQAGGGVGAANKRRGNAIREEVRWAREREAVMVGRRQGRKVVRRGMFLLE